MPKFEKSPLAPEGKVHISWADFELDIDSKPVNVEGQAVSLAQEHPFLQEVGTEQPKVKVPATDPEDAATLFEPIKGDD